MDKAEKFWDFLSKNYDKEDYESNPNYLKTIEKIKEYSALDFNVLDFGTATGRISFGIAPFVHEVQAIDLSSKMISIANRNKRTKNVSNINFKHTTIFDIDLKEESFDIIIALNIFHLLENPQKEFERVYELLKPGGVLISSSACMGNNSNILPGTIKFFKWLRLIPTIQAFKYSELENLFIKNNFSITEKEKRFDGKLSYLIIANK